MKIWLSLVLFAVVLVSACVQFGGQKAEFGFSEITTNPDLGLKVETVEQIKSGRNLTVSFQLDNKRAIECEPNI